MSVEIKKNQTDNKNGKGNSILQRLEKINNQIGFRGENEKKQGIGKVLIINFEERNNNPEVLVIGYKADRELGIISHNSPLAQEILRLKEELPFNKKSITLSFNNPVGEKTNVKLLGVFDIDEILEKNRGQQEIFLSLLKNLEGDII